MNNCISCGSVLKSRNKYCEDCRDTAAPWRVNDDAVRQACSRLGISVSVYVRRSTGRTVKGRYHGIRLTTDAPTDPDQIASFSDDDLNNMMYHYITISARMHPEDASRTLWHELTHASQFEKDPLYWIKYNTELAQHMQTKSSNDAYRSVSFEIEAKANEANHNFMPLTLANKRANMRRTKNDHHRVAAVIDGKIIDGKYATLYRENNNDRIRDAKQRLATM